jgi:hypothetical protein
MKEMLWRKLLSRKFWALLSALVVCLLTVAGAEKGDIERVVALIGAFGSCAAYMFAEAVTDRAESKTNDNT